MTEGNVTKETLGELNGLVTKELIRRINDGEANSSDLNAAIKLLTHNRVEADDLEKLQQEREFLSDLEFPF